MLLLIDVEAVAGLLFGVFWLLGIADGILLDGVRPTLLVTVDALVVEPGIVLLFSVSSSYNESSSSSSSDSAPLFFLSRSVYMSMRISVLFSLLISSFSSFVSSASPMLICLICLVLFSPSGLINGSIILFIRFLITE